ncbi:WD40 repeat-like protein [Tilletiopsis washingtonensis]|uniref:WD40 repeat-like protein n=1 Tax=Tilletiopsis washingtonensis TaxID=58919 RepID=A0A316ZEY4_9BASI|nr:WD40 repeat-like protein [Tilletiopsis washingtonensis]PWO00328.1 WD40 repeat-like protein [Tilletiopsis washingtonensis]
MALFGNSTSFGAPQQTLGNTAAAAPSGDVEVSQPPPDGISALAFSSAADFLAASSWDNAVRVYGVEPNGSTAPKAMYQHEAPVLDVVWSKDGSKIISAGADKAARLYDVQSGQAQQVAAHDAPIKSVRWVDQGAGILATGSWDKTVKYWDMRQPNPVSTAQLAERCYTMDCVWPYLVVGTAERKIQIFDLQQNPGVPIITMDSPLKYQTRVISLFQRQPEPGQPTPPPGFAIGSVEGRVAIQYIRDENKNLNFSFKCHRKDPPAASREPQQLFCVNDISFHPVQGTFSTVGSDGSINFWDKDSKTRLKTFDSKGSPIAASAFNRTGSIFAYAVSYDWHKGHSFAPPSGSNTNKIFLHSCTDEEVKRRPKKI